MRQLIILTASLCTLFVGCGGESSTGEDGGDMPSGGEAGQAMGGEPTGGTSMGGDPAGGLPMGGAPEGGDSEAGTSGSSSAAICRLMSSTADTTVNGMSSVITTTCAWEGDVQTCSSEGPSYTSTGVTTFDCSGGWCKMLANETSIVSNGMTTETSTTCTWADLTQTCTTGAPVSTVTVSEHNQYGVATSTQVEGEGFSSRSEMSYDCSGGWCRLLNTDSSSTFAGMTTMTSTPCTWEGNVQRCEASDGSSVTLSEFNEHGAMTTSQATGQGYSSSSEMSYECSEG